MGLNLADCVELPARQFPRRTAVASGDFALSYTQLRDYVRAAAGAFRRLGLQRGERVVVLLPNTPQFPIAYFGILHAGGVAVTLNPGLTVPELAYILADCDPRFIVAWPDIAEAARRARDHSAPAARILLAEPDGVPAECGDDLSFSAELARSRPGVPMVETGPDDVAVIMYAAAYDGWPKGVQLTHFNLFQNASTVAGRMLQYTPEDRCLAVLPLFHGFGQTVMMNAPLLAGASCVLMPRFDAARVLETIAAAGISVVAFVPTMFHFILACKTDAPPDLSSLRLVLAGGATMPLELFDAFRERFGHTILEGYGLTETSPVVTFNMSIEANRPGSVGMPLWGCEVRIADADGRPIPPGETGEVLVRGHNVMKGYLNQPDATAATVREGWLHTGDWGALDADGYLYLKGLKKDMLIRAGLNVYPREVERVLEEHPDVQEAAVIGIPDRVRGEEARAFVVSPLAGPDLEKALKSWCKERLTSYKCPRTVTFLVALPRDAGGNVDKRALRTLNAL